MLGLIQGYKQRFENLIFSALESAFLSFEFPPSLVLLSSPNCSIKGSSFWSLRKSCGFSSHYLWISHGNQQIQLSCGSYWSYMFPSGARVSKFHWFTHTVEKQMWTEEGSGSEDTECLSPSSISASPHPEWLWNHVGGSHQHQKILIEDNLKDQEIAECVICSRSHPGVCVHIYICVCM